MKMIVKSLTEHLNLGKILICLGFLIFLQEAQCLDKGCPLEDKQIYGCSEKRGQVLYKEIGEVWHPLRVPRELTPTQWKTEMLTHRIVLPLTAGEYCSLVDFLDPDEKEIPLEEDSSLHSSDSQVQELIEKQKDLEERIQELANKPSEESLALSNLLIKGSAAMTLIVPEKGNSTFVTSLAPRFLWRYGDRFLFQAKFRFRLRNCDTDTELLYSTINYIINDYFTFRVGKNTLPLGFVWEKMTPEWINKLPNLPLPYVGRPLTPSADVGVEVRGATQIASCKYSQFIPPVIFYHLWVGNGPDQENGDIRLGCNYLDNNHNKSVGGKIGFRFDPFNLFALSGTRAQWNNNKYSGDVISSRSLFYNALVFEVNWLFWKRLQLLGEFIWTHREAVKNQARGIPSSWITELGYWCQLSVDLDFIKKKIIRNLEPVVRFSGVSSDLIGRSRHQWSIGLNYFISNKFILKTSFDLNTGEPNRFNLQFAYGF